MYAVFVSSPSSHWPKGWWIFYNFYHIKANLFASAYHLPSFTSSVNFCFDLPLMLHPSIDPSNKVVNQLECCNRWPTISLLLSTICLQQFEAVSAIKIKNTFLIPYIRLRKSIFKDTSTSHTNSRYFINLRYISYI